MEYLSNEERLDRLEKAFQNKSDFDAAVFEHHRKIINQFVARLSLFEHAIAEELAFQLSKEPVDDSRAWKHDFITRFKTKWESEASEGPLLGGSEKSEFELINFVRKISDAFINKVSEHESLFRQNNGGSTPPA